MMGLIVREEGELSDLKNSGLTKKGFLGVVQEKWLETKEKYPQNSYSLNKWHGLIGGLRQFLKGWGGNLKGEHKRIKEIMFQIRKLDDLENEGKGMEDSRFRRYRLEEEMEEILNDEEIYWQQRSSVKWILKGDTNTAFFHLAVNGRKRKKSIVNLEEQGQNISDPKEI